MRDPHTRLPAPISNVGPRRRGSVLRHPVAPIAQHLKYERAHLRIIDGALKRSISHDLFRHICRSVGRLNAVVHQYRREKIEENKLISTSTQSRDEGKADSRIAREEAEKREQSVPAVMRSTSGSVRRDSGSSQIPAPSSTTTTTEGSFPALPSVPQSTLTFIPHETVFSACIGPRNRVGELSKWITEAATEKEKFSFPAVGAIVPSAWVDAIAAVEGLGEKRGTPYLMWADAVKEFQRYFEDKRREVLDADDAGSILLEAMGFREAEGGIILSVKNKLSPALDDVIHLDPRWLIELVRRVVDHNLVDEVKQGQILQELDDYDRARGRTRTGYRDLCKTHK